MPEQNLPAAPPNDSNCVFSSPVMSFPLSEYAATWFPAAAESWFRMPSVRVAAVAVWPAANASVHDRLQFVVRSAPHRALKLAGSLTLAAALVRSEFGWNVPLVRMS